MQRPSSKIIIIIIFAVVVVVVVVHYFFSRPRKNSYLGTLSEKLKLLVEVHVYVYVDFDVQVHVKVHVVDVDVYGRAIDGFCWRKSLFKLVARIGSFRASHNLRASSWLAAIGHF